MSVYSVRQSPRGFGSSVKFAAASPRVIHSGATPTNRGTVAFSLRNSNRISTPSFSLGGANNQSSPLAGWQKVASAPPPVSQGKRASQVQGPSARMESQSCTASTPELKQQACVGENTALSRSTEKGSDVMLNALGRDLTKLAVNGDLDPLVGRKVQIEQMIQALARRRKNNPVLVGDPGVGKTAVVEGLAQRIVQGDVPDMLQDKSITEIDMCGLLAGTKNRGEFEERMKKVVDDVLKSSGQIIIFIDEIHTIVGTGGSGSSGSALDVASILKPACSR